MLGSKLKSKDVKIEAHFVFHIANANILYNCNVWGNWKGQKHVGYVISVDR